MQKKLWFFILPLSFWLEMVVASSVFQDNYHYQLLPLPIANSASQQGKNVQSGPRGTLQEFATQEPLKSPSYLHIASNGEHQLVAYNVQTQQYVPVANTLRLQLHDMADITGLIQDYNLQLTHQFAPRLLAFVRVASAHDLASAYQQLSNDSRVQKALLEFQASFAQPH